MTLRRTAGLALATAGLLAGLTGPATAAPVAPAGPLTTSRAVAAVTLTVDQANPETGQRYQLRTTPTDPASVTGVRIQWRSGKKWVTLQTLTHRKDGTYSLRLTATGFGARYFRAQVTRTDQTVTTSAPTKVTMWGWVRTANLDRPQHSMWTYDGDFVDAAGANRTGWYAEAWGDVDHWYDTYDIGGTCRAFRGTGTVQQDADAGGAVQFKVTHGPVSWTSDPVTADTPIAIRADFPAGLTRFTLAATNLHHADGQDAGPAVAGSAFLCSVNDTNPWD